MSGDSFVSLLEQLSVMDNNIRKLAEERYDSICRDNCNELPQMLLQVIVDKSNAESVQRLAAVLLRRHIVKEAENDSFVLTTESLSGFRSNLLLALENENEIYLKSRICDIVGLLCDEDMSEETWPDLLPYTYSCVQVCYVVLDTLYVLYMYF